MVIAVTADHRQVVEQSFWTPLHIIRKVCQFLTLIPFSDIVRQCRFVSSVNVADTG